MTDITIEMPSKYRFDRTKIHSFVKDLSAISPWKSSQAILVQWVIIVFTIYVALHFERWWLYPFALFLIATRQHALGIIVHDAVHYRLYKNNRLNDFVSDYFCAFPLGASTSLYRTFHLDHHRYTNTVKDPEVTLFHGKPDWTFPKTKRQLWGLFIKDLTGLSFLETVRDSKVVSPALNFFKDQTSGGLSHSERLSYGLFVTLWIAGMTVGKLWLYYLIFWILPAGITGAIFRLRMIAEHYGVPNDREINGTRSVTGTWLERLLIAPLNVNFHLEHHMFPSVPFFNLKKLRDQLLLEPEFYRKAHITSSYLGPESSVIKELQRTSHQR